MHISQHSCRSPAVELALGSVLDPPAWGVSSRIIAHQSWVYPYILLVCFLKLNLHYLLNLHYFFKKYFIHSFDRESE